MKTRHTTSIRFSGGKALMAFAALAVAVALVAFPRLEEFFQIQAGLRGKETLRLTVEGLNGALRRYEPLPGLIAERPVLAEVLMAPDDPELLRRVNEELRLTAERLKASDVYLMDTTGLTIAASSYRKELSFVGRNFGYRPYFTQAVEGGLGRFFALGITSGQRGYFYAFPVEVDRRIVGVVAVKFLVAPFEDAWRGGDHWVIVEDLNGVVFMSSDPRWHFRTLRPLSAEDRERIEAVRQYPVERMELLPTTVSPLRDDIALTSIEVDEEDGGRRQFISSTLSIHDAGWDVTILIPTERAHTQALGAVSILALLIMLLGFGAAFYLQRRAQLLERIAVQRAATETLETRIAERTVDLKQANDKLVGEVRERRDAENRLRQTQTELIQAGKLAALGQMSAALSHEFNQPLAAVKSYADNAVRFLERGRSGEARENIRRISAMADRMASISKHLRNFARRPQEKVRPVELVPVMNDALAILQGRLEASRVDVRLVLPEDPAWVTGGHIRLQQVIVNLLNNALDAMEGQASPVIEVELARAGERWSLRIRDHGPGIDQETIGKIFDPFFTTKTPGRGLGLGLSISYNIIRDFGGRLLAQNHDQNGAVFCLELQAAQVETPALEAQETAAE
ncbi:ATP-binding protein [Stappia stellulata]|uniref:ATP-binding protein n=1 Tax=Stappia stellulata TaxID=71235 RepID=UPI00041DDEC6|nr:ATP-binding protein [Stappia stellulata]